MVVCWPVWLVNIVRRGTTWVSIILLHRDVINVMTHITGL